MKLASNFTCILISAISIVFINVTSWAESWKTIGEPDQVRNLITDKALNGNYWKFYFRSDGTMAYEQAGFISVREWKINAQGAICMNIYSMPDKDLGCEIISVSDGSTPEYRLEGKTGRHLVQILDPEKALIDAVTKKAGAVD